MKFSEKKKIYVDLFFVFHKFQGDSSFYTKSQTISRVQGANRFTGFSKVSRSHGNPDFKHNLKMLKQGLRRHL